MQQGAPTPEVAEFEDVHLGDDEIWRGRHIGSGREADGASWTEFLGHACVIRTIEGLKRAMG